MLAPAGFWFLRHGQTDWNARGISQGAVDVPLNAHGEEQARRAGELLRTAGIASIIASPFARARRTAEIVGAALGREVAYDPELREVTFAGHDGEPLGAWLDEWAAGATSPPGAETFAELAARAERAVGRALALPAPVLVVSHGALFAALSVAMRLSLGIHSSRNAVPVFCAPPAVPGAPWSLTTARPSPSELPPCRN